MFFDSVCDFVRISEQQSINEVLHTCNELKIANRYWKASVSLLNVNIPNNHVIPSKGNSTTADLTPDLSHKNVCTASIVI